MDFFETRERYRRREMKSYISLMLRVLVVGGVLWLGWVWGHAETGSLRAEAERALYENNQRISELSTEVQTLKLELAEAQPGKFDATFGFVVESDVLGSADVASKVNSTVPPTAEGMALPPPKASSIKVRSSY